MDIIVCVKRVPDTGAKVEIDSSGIDIKRDIPWVINPYDEFAIEEALRIKEKLGGKVILLHAGAEGGEDILKKGIAMGADEAVYVKDPRFVALDIMAVAKALCAVIKNTAFDIILCGKMGTDASSGVIGNALAALLNIPCVTAIKKLTISPDAKKAEADIEIEGGCTPGRGCAPGSGMETVECSLPALFTAHRGLNEPRYPSLSGIMRAKKQEIKYLSLASLGITSGGCGFKREALSCPPTSRKGVILNGSVRSQVKEAIKFLRHEVKII